MVVFSVLGVYKDSYIKIGTCWLSLAFLFYQHCEKKPLSCRNTNIKAITAVFCTNKITLTMIDSAVHGALNEVKSNR